MNPLVYLIVSFLCMVYGLATLFAFSEDAGDELKPFAFVLWLAAVGTFMGSLVRLIVIASQHL